MQISFTDVLIFVSILSVPNYANKIFILVAYLLYYKQVEEEKEC